MDFAGLPVVVTGGAGALGEAVVAALLEAGAACIVPVRDGRAARGTPRKGLSIAAGVDLAEEDAVARFYGALPALWASLHLAGGFGAASLADTSAAEFDRLVTLNLRTSFLCCREAAKAMRARPAPGRRGGRIVNVAARPALEPRHGAGMAAYAAAKAGVAALTAALGEELAPEGIWVNAVAPSIIDTPANRAAMPKADAARWPKPDEIASAILFLASPANAATRGAVVPVYGRA